MSVRVRFAPSPTGYLHIGGARTALYSYLFAKAMGGKYILRIEDTDQERSKREYETSQIEDLKWCGVEHDEGPDVGGEFGPYRQSERLDLYKKYAQNLLDRDLAYYAFDTDEELAAMKEKQERENLAPHYDGIYKSMSKQETQKLLDEGKEGVIRFRAPQKAYEFDDVVRGNVAFPEGMVGDFVIMRSNGLPVYNFCCVVDDALMKMTHIIRAEEHLPNTLRQMMIYEALEFELPRFVHVSLLVGEDRQKLSKRHGATSVTQYREQNYISSALMNYLCLLGWSHPDEADVFDVNELGELFSLKRLSKSPALFDVQKLQHINGEHLRKLSLEKIVASAEVSLGPDHPFSKQDMNWKNDCMNFFKDHINFFEDLASKLTLIFDEKFTPTPGNENDEKNHAEFLDILTWETTQTMKNYLSSEIKSKIDGGEKFISEDDFNAWCSHLKKELKIKGKPLFKGLRACLTGRAEGLELKYVAPLTPLEILLKRCS